MVAAAFDGSLADEGSARRHDEVGFVAQEGTEVVGFAHVAIGRPRHDDSVDAGLVRFLWYRPGRRQVGSALAETAESYVRDQGAAQVVAFYQDHRYPFYHLHAAHLSDRLGHVAALLGLRGYEKTAGEVFLDWRNFSVVAPGQDAFDLRYTVEYPQGEGRRPGVVVRAWQGDREAGVCVNECVGDYVPARGAHDWLFTEWLGIEDEFQGRGLGRLLLQRALAAGRELGYRHASISTDWRNYRAFVFYSNFGYHVADWTYAYARAVS
jgi:GNAT superfamily N-acetyltransferase